MGNCGIKSKQNVNQNAIITQKIDSKPIKCSYCSIQFSVETHMTAIANHIQTCINTADNNVIINLEGLTTANKPRISEKISCNPNVKKSYEPFMWVKKKSSNNKYIWVKQQAIKTEMKTNDLAMDEITHLNFEEKRAWFRNGLELLRIPWELGADYVRVERERLLESSLEGFQNCNLFKEVKVEFKGDEKVNDAGGLMREWMSIMIKELVKPEIGLFVKTDCEEVIYTINSKSSDSEKTLKLYEFAGRIFGKAIFERISLNMHFDDCLLKAMSGKQLILEDIKSLETPLYNSLSFLQLNTIAGSDIFEEYFVLPERGGKSLELCPKGAQKLVTDENKHQYIKLLLEWYGKRRIEKKIIAFIRGVSACIALETLSVFDPRELEMIINGVPTIDVEDWEYHTIFKGCLHKTHSVTKWFWKILNEMTQEELGKLLQFCTGSSRTPVEGFRALESNRGTFAKFCIEGTMYEESQSLITAHTCFNRLVLPLYPTEQLLRKELGFIIRSDFQGVFGLE